jgi:hypothetical protein
MMKVWYEGKNQDEQLKRFEVARSPNKGAKDPHYTMIDEQGARAGEHHELKRHDERDRSNIFSCCSYHLNDGRRFIKTRTSI